MTTSGLNLVELLVFATTAEFASKQKFTSIDEASGELLCAFSILTYGMKRLGYRFHGGLLQSPYGNFYEGVGAVKHILQKMRENHV